VSGCGEEGSSSEARGYKLDKDENIGPSGRETKG